MQSLEESLRMVNDDGRPQDWPGIHCVNALLMGKPLEGTWFDRTRNSPPAPLGGVRSAEVRHGGDLTLDPLPCWKHLTDTERRSRVRELIAEIEREAAARREETGIPSLGADAILAQDP